MGQHLRVARWLLYPAQTVSYKCRAASRSQRAKPVELSLRPQPHLPLALCRPRFPPRSAILSPPFVSETRHPAAPAGPHISEMELETVLSSEFATQMLTPSKAMPKGSLPAPSVLNILPFFLRSTTTLSLPLLVTQILVPS